MTCGLAPGRLCLVTSRHRLAAACGCAADEGAHLVVQQAEAAARAELGALHLREGDLSAAALFSLATRVAAVLGGRTTLLVNDRADVAALVRAGVHLRETSMPVARIRLGLPTVQPIWRAVHDVSGARNAGAVDAVVAGTVFSTTSKAAGPTLGPSGLAAIVAAATAPVYAIGGITGALWPVLATTGATGAAAIGVFLPRTGESIAGAVQRAVQGFANGVD